MYRIAFCASKAHFRLSLILPGPGIDDLGGSWGIIQDWSVLHKLLTSGLCSGGELLWGVLQNQHKADSLLSAALLEFGVSSWCVLPAGGSLGAAFPTPKTHQAGAGLHSSEIFSQRGVDGLELLWFQHCLGWCFRRQRGGNELLLGQTPLLSLWFPERLLVQDCSAWTQIKHSAHPYLCAAGRCAGSLTKLSADWIPSTLQGSRSTKSSQFLARSRGLGSCLDGTADTALPLTCKFCKLWGKRLFMKIKTEKND